MSREKIDELHAQIVHWRGTGQMTQWESPSSEIQDMVRRLYSEKSVCKTAERRSRVLDSIQAAHYRGPRSMRLLQLYEVAGVAALNMIGEGS